MKLQRCFLISYLLLRFARASGPLNGNRWRSLHRHDDSDDDVPGFVGAGRDFSIFERSARPQSDKHTHHDNEVSAEDIKEVDDVSVKSRSNTVDGWYRQPSSADPESYRFSKFQHHAGGRRSSNPRRQQRLSSVQKRATDWWSSNVLAHWKHLPQIHCVVEPTTSLKLRKTLRLFKTIFSVAADFNTQTGVWQFQSSWEDAIIGGRITLAGRELQLTKSWPIQPMRDVVTRLRLRAAVDLGTAKAYLRVGFRTERVAAINMVEGFGLIQHVPLDGTNGNVKLQVKAHVKLPEPEIEYSTETQRSVLGMGNVEVSIDELNLLLDY